MAEMQEEDDSADSRTAVLGEKRGYQEFIMPPAASNSDSLAKDESGYRLEKRAKVDHEVSKDSFKKDNSPSHQIVTIKEHGAYEPLAPPTLSPAVAPAMAWNKGIQTGLRTSFAGKLKTKTSYSAGHAMIPGGGETAPPSSALSGRADAGQGVADSIEEGVPRKTVDDQAPLVDKGSQGTSSPTSAPLLVSRKLSRSQRAKLTEEEIREHQAAHKAFLSSDNRAEATKEAAEVFKRIPQPWPKEYRGLSHKIRVGGTFYATPGPKLKKRKCESDGLEFSLSPVKAGGQPIRLQDFNYNLFVPQIVKDNQQHWASLTRSHVVECFDAYLKMFYGHVKDSHEPVLATAEADDATSIEEAIRDVTQKLHIAPAGLVPSAEKGDVLVEVSSAKEPSFLFSTDGAPLPSQIPENADSQHIKIKGASEESRVNDRFRTRSQSSSSSYPTQFVMGTGKERLQQDNAFDILPDMGGTAPTGTLSLKANPAQEDGMHNGSPANNDLIQSLTKPVRSDKVVVDTFAVPRSEAATDGSGFTEPDVALQLRYFPRTEGQLVVRRCLACADSGHSTSDCPILTCNLCGIVGSHSSFTCPQRQKCGKCRQPGHQTSNCREKLRPAKSEVECQICSDADHTEDSCHFIWRSYAPKLGNTRLVRSIALHCYRCGASGHYGPACGLQPAGRILSGGITWSEANLRKYVDVNSQNRAISAGIDYSIKPNSKRAKRSLTIKGRANDQITLEDSDDDASSFIRPKINQPAARGEIQFGRNLRSAQAPQGPTHQLPPRPSAYQQPTSNCRVESARYGRERTFSPPPRLDDFRYIVPENERRYHSDSRGGQRENSYRPGATESYRYPPSHPHSSKDDFIAQRGLAAGDIRRGTHGGGPGRGRGRGDGNSAKGGSNVPKSGKKATKGNANAQKGTNTAAPIKGGIKRKPRISKQDRARMAAGKAAEG